MLKHSIGSPNQNTVDKCGQTASTHPPVFPSFVCPLWWEFCHIINALDCNTFRKIPWSAELFWGLKAPFKGPLWCSSRKKSLLEWWCLLKKLLDLLLDASSHTGFSPVISFPKIQLIIWSINILLHWSHHWALVETIKLHSMHKKLFPLILQGSRCL